MPTLTAPDGTELAYRTVGGGDEALGGLRRASGVAVREPLARDVQLSGRARRDR
jgi:hypothetical protein